MLTYWLTSFGARLGRNPKQRRAYLLVITLLTCLSSCVDKYTPDVITAPQSYLVVDGFINLQGVTTVRLTRTRSLSAGATSPAEAKATVAIQDEGGTRYPLTEQATAGTYASAALTLGATHQYQLRVRTAAGREYASDLVAGKLSPAIDNLSWDQSAAGVQVYVDAHDATGNSRYYRWAYQETWEYTTPFQSTIEYKNGQMVTRAEDIYRCWRSESSTAIKLTATDKLSQDVVSKFPLTLLANTSQKLRVRYSILVQQHAQTAEEFLYWDKLRKNTETLGTLFDPLPSQLTGNVHCLTDAAELVLGYVGAGSVAEKRLFINSLQLPPGTRYATGYETCLPPDTVLVKDVPVRFNSSQVLPVYTVYFPRTYTVMGYASAATDCVDCRLRGTNVRPSFW